MKGLTLKQRAMYEYIKDFIEQENMAPTVYELAEKFNVKTSTVFAHLHALMKKGYIKRSSKARSIVLMRKTKLMPIDKSHIIEVPLIGRVAAGLPADSPEYREGTVMCDSSYIRGNITKLFALTINGESMRDAGILDGDVVIVQQTTHIRRGDIIVAMVNNETTVKTYFPAPDNRIELRPANPEFKSQFYPAEEVEVQGKVVSLQRRY